MTKIKVSVFVLLFSIFVVVACNGNDQVEVTADNAIRIASDYASTKNYNTTMTDVEILKVKKGEERGPIRLVWLMKFFSKEEMPTLLNNEFWIVYFYPKGALDNRKTLGGGFCALVELYSGNILSSFEDQ